MASKELRRKLTGWILILLIAILAYQVSLIEDSNIFFISLLIAANLFVILSRKTFTKTQVTIARSILGAVFIYSGLMKGIDPVGTEYRVEDYFIAFGMDWARPWSLFLSVILNTSEFLLGILLFFNVKIKITSWLVLLMMGFFTLVTINDALYNPVPDCGCFGDALVITNWQTFYKNLIIDALLLIVFLSRNRTNGWFKAGIEWSIVGLFIIGFTWFQLININHLPMTDFRNWKVGNKMIHENPLPKKYYLTFKNIETGETKEYISPDYPYNDSAWMAINEFVDQRVLDPNPILHDLSIEDADGNNYTVDIIENPGLQFILVAVDLETMDLERVDDIRDFVNSCNSGAYSIAVITSSLPDEAEVFKAQQQFDVDFYFADDISLKTMIRSNPGLLLLNNGVVMAKWHNNDIPDFDEIITQY